MTSRTLAIDADVLFYKFAHRNTSTYEWSGGAESSSIDEALAIQEFDEFIEELLEATGCDKYLMIISSDYNFRYLVLPTYKHNRVDVEKPLLHQVLQKHCMENHPHFIWKWLEADDVLGILGTFLGNPEATAYLKRKLGIHFNPDGFIVSSIDKDMRSFPCTLFNWDKDEFPYQITEAEADRWFHIQIMAGDSTDGYYGAPGIGLGYASQYLDGMIKAESYEHTFVRGKRKGETEVRWKKVPAESIWEVITSWYLKSGIADEEDIIQQARVARILRAEDYNYKTDEVIYWTPPDNMR